MKRITVIGLGLLLAVAASLPAAAENVKDLPTVFAEVIDAQFGGDIAHLFGGFTAGLLPLLAA